MDMNRCSRTLTPSLRVERGPGASHRPGIDPLLRVQDRTVASKPAAKLPSSPPGRRGRNKGQAVPRLRGGAGAPAKLLCMGEAISTAGKKVLAVAVLLLAAWILFKVVLGFVTAVAWIAVVVLAIIAIVWALRVL